MKQKVWYFDMVAMSDSLRSAIVASTMQTKVAVIRADGTNGKSEIIAYMPIQGKWNTTDANNAKRLLVALYVHARLEKEQPGITDHLYKLLTSKQEGDES